MTSAKASSDEKVTEIKDAKSESVSPNIVHEAEVQRQHVRLQLPIKVKVGKLVLEAEDWSNAGMSIVWPESGIEALGKDIRIGKTLQAELLYPFADFELTVPIQFEVRFINASNNRLGCRFVDLTASQVSILQHVVSAYISGDVVQAGDLLHVVSRDSSTQARKVPPAESDMSTGALLARKFRRFAMMALILGGSLAVFGLLFSALYERAYVVKARTAFVSAEMLSVNSSVAGQVFFQQPNVDVTVKKGQPLLTVRTDTDKLISIDSPCDCVIKRRLVDNSARVSVGKPVLRLAALDAATYISARLNYVDAVEVAQGSIARYKLPGEKTYQRGVVTRMETSDSGEVITVLVEPETALDAAYIDDPVIVKFDTLLFSK